jgi:hypothetical protein
LKKKIRKAKRKKERELVNSDDRNGKKFTNYVKSKTKVRTGIGPLKKTGWHHDNRWKRNGGYFELILF